jgi:hypothetical protein
MSWALATASPCSRRVTMKTPHSARSAITFKPSTKEAKFASLPAERSKPYAAGFSWNASNANKKSTHENQTLRMSCVRTVIRNYTSSNALRPNSKHANLGFFRPVVLSGGRGGLWTIRSPERMAGRKKPRFPTQIFRPVVLSGGRGSLWTIRSPERVAGRKKPRFPPQSGACSASSARVSTQARKTTMRGYLRIM